jgi:membrane protein
MSKAGAAARRGRWRPLAILAATAGLLAAGFRRERYASPPPDGEKSASVAWSDGTAGRQADAPSEIPARGWRDVLRRVWRRIGEDRLLAVAAGVTFYALLAIVPTLAALISVYGFFADPPTIERHLDQLAGLVPAEGLQLIRDQMKRLAAEDRASLGLRFVFSLALSLWSANAGVKALFDALNVAYEEKEKRGFLKLNAISLLFTAGVIAFLLLAIAAIVVVPAVLQLMHLPGGSGLVMALARWPLLLLAVVLLLSLMYRFGPSRDAARWQWVSWGSTFAAFAWLGVSALFSWYAANFGSYNKTYGSLGAVIGFMTWIWLSTVVILLGALINAEAEHQTARDSTQGPPQPMGQRGAVKADTVAPASE